jgi:hypothetical protein
VDFLVAFAPLPPAEYARKFFALLEALSSLLSRNVDLVVDRAVHNPYFLANLQNFREPLCIRRRYGSRNRLHLVIRDTLRLAAMSRPLTPSSCKVRMADKSSAVSDCGWVAAIVLFGGL